jgi:hypothetical protein
MTIRLAAGGYDMADEPSVLPRTGPVDARKSLTPAAKRALAEAEARRAATQTTVSDGPKEVQGPKGPEPTRFGDWERNGIASDF